MVSVMARVANTRTHTHTHVHTRPPRSSGLDLQSMVSVMARVANTQECVVLSGGRIDAGAGEGENEGKNSSSRSQCEAFYLKVADEATTATSADAGTTPASG